MPDARLQRTRDAYPDERPLDLVDLIRGLPILPPLRYRIWTDETTGITHRERVQDVFTVMREPSDDDLWGV